MSSISNFINIFHYVTSIFDHYISSSFRKLSYVTFNFKEYGDAIAI